MTRATMNNTTYTPKMAKMPHQRWVQPYASPSSNAAAMPTNKVHRGAFVEFAHCRHLLPPPAFMLQLYPAYRLNNRLTTWSAHSGTAPYHRMGGA